MSWMNRSLVNKLTFMITLGFSLVLIVFFVITFRLITHRLEENIIEKTYVQSESISNQIVHIFQNAKQNTEQMALNRDIIRYLKEVETRKDVFDNPNYEYVLKYINAIKNSSELHFLAWVANEKANFYLDNTNTVPGDDYDVTKRPWYEVAANAKDVAFTKPYIEWITKKVVISSILALREDDKIFGFVVVDIMLDTIPILFKNNAFSPHDMSFLISDDGTYIYHPDPAYILNKSVNDIDDPLKHYLMESTNEERAFKAITLNDEEYYLTTYSVDENNWKVVTLIHKNALFSQLVPFYALILFMMFFALLIIIVVVKNVVKLEISPYKTLVEFAEAIEHGKYSVQIPKPYLERDDEMGEICKSFQRVLSKLHGENLVLEKHIELKNIELESQYQYILETEKVASLGNLVAGVAHEINTPLGVSIASASYIQQLTHQSLDAISLGQLTKEKLIAYFEDVSESSELMMNNLVRAADLVKSFKNVAVYQTNEVKELFNFKAMLDDCILSCKNLYKNKLIVFDVIGDANLLINSYPGAYTQIITNFIVNSCTHGNFDEKNGVIHIEFAKIENSFQIVYSDNGSGIEASELSKIFEPFYTTNRENGNSGLGLSIVFNLVTQILGGTLKAKSSIGEGLAFTIVVSDYEN